MGISQSLFTGVTGLSTNSDGMAVVANNIANANSRGFKYDRAEFEDLLSQSLNNNSQLGRGARLKGIRTIHNQGGMAVTDNITDLAIQGTGFFMVSNPKSEKSESGGQFYTRVGSFNFDRDGFLADMFGGHVMGYMADANGTVSSRLSEVRIVTNSLPPAKTKKLAMTLNLDSREKVMEGEFNLESPEKSSNFNNTIALYDSQGRAHQTTIFYKRVADTDGISWQWHAAVDKTELADASGNAKMAEFASGTVKFDNLGNLKEQIVDKNVANFSDGALPEQMIEFDFGKVAAVGTSGPAVGATTSVAGKSATVYHSQDGYESGNLKTMKIDLDGSIQGFYTNGVSRTLGSLAMATFENQDGLEKAGRNMFISTIGSGPPKVGTPQSGTRGSVYSSSLEESNVDLAGQFVNMIMTQRAFQANSRSVTTTDSMIEEVLQMKR